MQYLAVLALWYVFEFSRVVLSPTLTAIFPESMLQRRVTQSISLPCAGVGDPMLRGLLETPISALGGGFPVVTMKDTGTILNLSGVLGYGGSSVVYSAMVGGVCAAVKVISNGTFAGTEIEALKRLITGCVTGTPRIVCHVSEDNVIVTCPVGRALATTKEDVDIALTMYRAGLLSAATPSQLLNPRLLRDALTVLLSMHRCGVIHGDPRLSNFIVVEATFKSKSTVVSYEVAAASTPPNSCMAIDFGCAILGQRFSSGTAWTYLLRHPVVWVSLPYAPPEQLRAFANNVEYEPKPWHDLFMLAASLYRLLGYNAPQAHDQAEALALANYWELLMNPTQTHTCDASAASPGDASRVSTSAAGRLLVAACNYDIARFEVIAAELMRSYAADWPQSW